MFEQWGQTVRPESSRPAGLGAEAISSECPDLSRVLRLLKTEERLTTSPPPGATARPGERKEKPLGRLEKQDERDRCNRGPA